jgi:hypothetical protein
MGGPLYEPHLKLNAYFFAVEDLGLIEPVRLTQAYSTVCMVPVASAKFGLHAGNMKFFVRSFVCLLFS